MPPVSIADLSAARAGESSATVAARVLRARQVQQQRFAPYAAQMDSALNSAAPPDIIEKTMILEEDSRVLLQNAAERLKLSARAYHRVLRAARTIADLDPAAPETLGSDHIAEALGYRPLRLR